jgi:hypothetical protein
MSSQNHSTYLEELIVPYTPGRSLRSENEDLLQQPRDVRTKTYGERRFDRAGAVIKINKNDRDFANIW